MAPTRCESSEEKGGGPQSPTSLGIRGGSPSKQGGGRAPRWLSSLPALSTSQVTLWKGRSQEGPLLRASLSEAWSRRPLMRREAGAPSLLLQPDMGPGCGQGLDVGDPHTHR